MNIIELKRNDEVETSIGDITKVVQQEDCIEFTMVSEEKNPEYKYIAISGESSYHQVNFKKEIIFQISEEIEVFCEDWTEDENMSKENLDESWMRWDDAREIVEWNQDRVIGTTDYDLPSDYINHLHLEYACIDKLFFDEKKNKFLLILRAPFNNTSRDGISYFSGPFRFYCKKVKLIVD